MPTTNKRIKGGCPKLELFATLLAASGVGSTFTTTGTATAWPDGSSSRSFVVGIGDPDTATFEAILCSSRSGNVFTIEQRGYDDTTALQHDAGADIWLYIDGASLQSYEDHLVDTADAHDASAISYAGGTGMSATDVEAAIDELATEKANSTALSDYLPLAGGTMSGALAMADNELRRPKLKDYSEICVEDNDSGATHTINIEDGNVHHLKLTANCTLTFSNPIASGDATSFTLVLEQDATGSRTVTWPASVKWAGGVAPTLTTTAARFDVLTFFTVDGGTRWFGFVAGQNFS